jgi:hypothetical protein
MEELSLELIRNYPKMNRNLIGTWADCSVWMLEEHHHQSGSTTLEFNRIEKPNINRKRVRYRQNRLVWESIDKNGYGGRSRIAEDAGYGMALLYLRLEFNETDWDFTLTFRTEIGSGVDLHFEPTLELNLSPTHSENYLAEATVLKPMGIEVKASATETNIINYIADAENQIHHATQNLSSNRSYLIVATAFETPSINIQNVIIRNKHES